MTEEQTAGQTPQAIDLMQFVPKVHFEQIPIRNLVSNQEYQRNLSQHHVQRAAANFDLYQINPVKVSRRNGINYVFNGQHTIEIVALVSGSRETPVWCMVYDDLGYEHEADIFANQMKYVKPLLPYEIFMANIEAGNDKQLIIRDLVESYDLTIASTTTPGGICAVATLENIHDKYGYHMLDHVIRLIAATWEGASQSFSANMMNGLARFLNAYGDAIKDDVFKEKLGRISIKELARTAKDRRSGSLGFAEAILIYYNKKSRNPLTWDKLYTHKLPHKRTWKKNRPTFLSLGMRTVKAARWSCLDFITAGFPGDLHGNLYPAAFQKEELIFFRTKHRHFAEDKLCDLRDESGKRFISHGFHHLPRPDLFKRCPVRLHLLPSFHMLIPVRDQSVECFYKSLFQVCIIHIGIRACHFPVFPVVLALPLYDSP